MNKEIIKDLKKMKEDAREKADACDARDEPNMESYWLGRVDTIDYILTVYGDES